jgi:phosphohistidine swiveling domain-containing protein
MPNDLYIRLGSGQAKSHHVGNKGGLLDKAVVAGLSVPEGVLLLDTVWDQALLMGLIEVCDGQVVVTDAEALSSFLNLPTFTKPVAVRSAFSAEDRVDESLAGYYETVLRVDASKPDQLAMALCRVLMPVMGTQTATLEIPVFKVSDSQPLMPVRPLRRDVLIMEMVSAERSGVAFTEREYEDDLVNFTSGTAEKLVAGEVPGEAVLIPKLRGWEKQPIGVTGWQARLQALLRDVRRWIGNKDWDLEWADDGVKCWLVQLRPVTRPTRRNEVFTIANHKEILPELPSTFMTGIVESCAGDLFRYYRQFDRRLPEKRPMIEVFHGRPYLNLSLLSEMMRIFGLPTRMVTDNIGGEAGHEAGFRFSRLIANSLTLRLPRFGLAQMLSVQTAKRATRQMEQRSQQPVTTFAEAVELTRWLYTRLVTQMFSLTAAIGPMLLILRWLGVIDEHSARQQTISTRMYTQLEPLRQLALQNPEIKGQLERGELPDLPEFQQAWAAYLVQYGHRGKYESDVARPRYHEDPAALLAAVVTPGFERGELPARTWRGWLTQPLWWQASRTMQALEQWRHDIMRGFDRARAALLKLAAAKGLDPEVLWLLTPTEVRRLDAGWLPDTKFLKQRRAEIERLKTYRLPDLFHRFDDLEEHRAGVENVADHCGEKLTGVSLTRGEVSGQAWVLDEPAVTLPDDFQPHLTILIARAVDAGWIPTFARVAGVVVETGGDLSHGSIILREIGLPAITNVRGATRMIRTGDNVRLRAASGVVEIGDLPLTL